MKINNILWDLSPGERGGKPSSRITWLLLCSSRNPENVKMKHKISLKQDLWGKVLHLGAHCAGKSLKLFGPEEAGEKLS